MLVLTLPFPPSINTYWRTWNGRTLLSKEGRLFKKAVADYVIEYRVPRLGDSKLRISMVLFPRDKRKIDIDNRIKSVLDALGDAGVFTDDFQVDELSIVRGITIKGGGIRVIIEQIDSDSSESSSPLENS